MVERNLAKVEVESSRLFSRSKFREDMTSRLIRHITGRVSCSKITSGEVAKRLCSGLQSRLDGFDSRPRLQIVSSTGPVQGPFAFPARLSAIRVIWICVALRQHTTERSHRSKMGSGEVAKRLCSGLQSRRDRFDSCPRLHIPSSFSPPAADDTAGQALRLPCMDPARRFAGFPTP